MPDMKNLDADPICEQIASVAEQGRKRLQEAAIEAIAAVRDVARAWKELPERADDLIDRAAAVLVKEFDVQVRTPGETRAVWNVGLDLDGNERIAFDTRGYTHVEDYPRLVPGRYRAILFILPVKDK